MKNKPLVYGLLFAAGFGFLLFKSVSNRGLGTSLPPAAGHGLTANAAQPSTVTNHGSRAANLAPDFTLPRLDGSTITLSEFRGEKPVILDFWASWCHNCQRAMPKLSRLYPEYKDQVEIIGVNLRENTNTIQRFVDSRNILYPIALDAGQVAQQYGIRYTNTHILIDRTGNIVQVIPGDLTERHITSLINA